MRYEQKTRPRSTPRYRRLAARWVAYQKARNQPLGHPLLGVRPIADRDSGFMDGIRVAGNKRVPPVKTFPLIHQTVGAGGWQPIQQGYGLRRNPGAVRNLSVAVLIVAATANTDIKHPAGKPSMYKLAGIFVFQLQQTAQATPVAKRLPFLLR